MTRLARLNAWIRELATTNFKIVVGAVLALGTMLFYFGSEMRCIAYVRESACRPIDRTNFGAWLLFVAAWAGISYKQFAKKRDTYAAPSPDSERAGVPAEPPPSAPAAAGDTLRPAPVPEPARIAAALQAHVAARGAAPGLPVGQLVEGDGD